MEKEERKKLNEDLFSKNSSIKFKALGKVAASMEDMEWEVHKAEACCSLSPCNRPFCKNCAMKRPRKRPSNSPGRDCLNPNEYREKSRNFRVAAGRWLAKPFQDLDQTKCHPVTINFYLGSMDLNPKSKTQFARNALRKLLQEEMSNARARFIFDVAVVDAKTSCSNYPSDSIDPEFHDRRRPDKPALLLHCHGFLYHPALSKCALSRTLRRAFPGCSRVCVSTLKPETENADGYKTRGIAGFGEYACREKINFNRPEEDETYDNVLIAERMLRVLKNWKRSSRRFSFNCNTSESFETNLVLHERDVTVNDQEIDNTVSLSIDNTVSSSDELTILPRLRTH